jgi:hypothetical protein
MMAMRRAIALVASAVLAVSPPSLAQDDQALALAVKATYLYKFAPFIEWPASASASETFDICAVGDDVYGDILGRAASDQTVHGRVIRARHFAIVTAAAASDCRIMYLAGSAAQSVASSLEAVRGAPILTVTDEARSEQYEGVVHFVIVRGRIKFKIDNLLAEENGLVISSQLLNLAISVRASSSDAGAPRVQ